MLKKSNFVIDVKNLKKNFNDKPAVIDVSLQVRRGEIFGFLGPNGAGKTTTIRMLCGLLTPSGGSGYCLEYDILTQSNLIKQHVGYLPQFFGLYKQLTIYENLLLMAELYGVVNKRNKVNNIMNKLDLASNRNQISGTLSGGWKQRLALGCALIHDPFLLLLDEPTASVDPSSRCDFWELMHDLSSEGMTILLSSHNMDEVERCNSIAYINNGRLVMKGNIKDIINKLNLITWRVKGTNLSLLAKQLKATFGIGQVMTYFNTLHVSGNNKLAFEKAIEPYLKNKNFQWEPIESTLDDAFIWLAHDPLNLD